MSNHNNFLVWKTKKLVDDQQNRYAIGYSTYVRGEKTYLPLFSLLEDDMYDLLGEDVYDFVVQKLKETFSVSITLTALKGWN